MNITVSNPSTGGGGPIALQCPVCGHHGVFTVVAGIHDLRVTGHWLGHRGCPNPNCHAHIFFIADNGFRLEHTYPPQRIAFDPTGVPGGIRDALSQAVTCHSEGCFVAAAIMVRRTLRGAVRG